MMWKSSSGVQLLLIPNCISHLVELTNNAGRFGSLTIPSSDLEVKVVG